MSHIKLLFKSIGLCKSRSSIYMFTFLMLSMVSSAHAFKVNTHVWVAQQVLNDVADDGEVTFVTPGKTVTIPVNEHVANALLNYPDIYRMGNLGPDTFPDTLVGQMFVHPGAVEGTGSWETDDWLNWMLTPVKPILNPAYSGVPSTQDLQKLAFSYGYLGHAAADSMAHTYVNQYSGDIFWLTDGEQQVEARHYVLESYIGYRTPPLVDHSGSYIGEPENLVKTPKYFIRDHLILNETVQSEYKKSLMGAHLASVFALKERLQYHISEGGPMDDVDRFIWAAIIEAETGIVLNEEQAEQVRVLMENIHDWLESGVGASVELLRNSRNKFVELVEKKVEIDRDLLLHLTEVMDDLIEIKAKLDGIYLDIIEELIKLQRLCDYFPSKTLCKVSPQYQTIEVAIRLLQYKYYKELELARSINENMSKIINDIAEIMLTAIEIENIHFNAVIDTGLLLRQDVNGIRSHLRLWIDGIDNGMAEYVNAFGETFALAMSENPGKPDTLEPLKNWQRCWGLAIAGLPSTHSTEICQIENLVNKIVELWEDIGMRMIGPFVMPTEWTDFLVAIDDELRELATEVEEEMVDRLLGPELQFVYDYVINSDMSKSDQVLTLLFSNDYTSKKLLIIPDIVQRIDAEMNLLPSKVNADLPFYKKDRVFFDSENYPVVRNAVTMAKLSLLTPSQMNELVRQLGVENKAPYNGLPLYAEADDDPMNPLIGSLRSIDGNHAWMRIAPPYLRRSGLGGWCDEDWRKNANGDLITNPENYGDPHRRFGYSPLKPVDGEASGFRIWQNEEARDFVFRKIFKGPLTPGIEIPRELDKKFKTLLPNNYPYKPSIDNPFPMFDPSLTNYCGHIDKSAIASSANPVGAIPAKVPEVVCDKAANTGVNNSMLGQICSNN